MQFKSFCKKGPFGCNFPLKKGPAFDQQTRPASGVRKVYFHGTACTVKKIKIYFQKRMVRDTKYLQ